MLARHCNSSPLCSYRLCALLLLHGIVGCSAGTDGTSGDPGFVEDANALGTPAAPDAALAGPFPVDASAARDDATASTDAGRKDFTDGGEDSGQADSAQVDSAQADGGQADSGRADSGQEVEDCTLAGLAAGDHRFTIKSKNGVTYDYILVVPRSLRPRHKAPLALVWHALSSSPEETRSLTNIDAEGEENGVLMVHPVSPDQAWDVGSCCTAVWGMKRDETVFVRELLAEVSSKVCVDEKRIYTSGFSNGGMISQLLACKMADVFAAAAPMGSTLTIDPATCHPSRAIPIWMINGTADPLVGYESPSLSGGLAVPDDIALWADRNKCKGSPRITLQKGAVTCRTYEDCDRGAQVTSCVVEGMGHCLPGMKKESSTNCLTKLIPLGMPNDDVDGVRLATDFLLKF